MLKNYFKNGVSSISDEIKTTMAFIGTKEEWKEFTQDEAKNVGIDGVGFSGEKIGILKIADFNSTYEEFFGSKPDNTIQLLKSVKTCPIMVIPNDDSAFGFVRAVRRRRRILASYFHAGRVRQNQRCIGARRRLLSDRRV